MVLTTYPGYITGMYRISVHAFQVLELMAQAENLSFEGIQSVLEVQALLLTRDKGS